MPTTLVVESFSEVNIRERAELKTGAGPGDTELEFKTTQGFVDGDVIYIGQLSREGCEKAVIQTVDSASTVTLASGLTLPHARFEAVSSVVGNKIRIYRAANIDGKVPTTASFALLLKQDGDPVEREIDPDQEARYYTDSTGDSNFWYRNTNYNPITGDETDLEYSIRVQGSDFGHYASLGEIRKEAGFENAYTLSDTVVDQQRRIAESEINGALGGNYTVPFTPVPERIHTLTIQLGAALLVANAYKGTNRGQAELKAARALIDAYRTGEQTITDEEGTAITTGQGISSCPGEDQPRAFKTGDRF